MTANGNQSLLNLCVSYISSINIIIYRQTRNPPATSTSTAKLVRCVLRHCTVVVFPSVLLLPILIPSDSQLPWPKLCQRRQNFVLQPKHDESIITTYGSEKFQYTQLKLAVSFTCKNVQCSIGIGHIHQLNYTEKGYSYVNNWYVMLKISYRCEVEG